MSTSSDGLSLRQLDSTDLDHVHALFSSDGHTMGDGPIEDLATTLRWLARRSHAYAVNGFPWYGLWDGDENCVGNCGVFRGRCGDDPEIGYEVALPRRGQGYARAAVRAVTDAAHLVGHRRLWATVRPVNFASVRTVQSNGYRSVRRARDAKGDLDYYVHDVDTQG